MTTLTELATPALILNKPKMAANIARMHAQLKRVATPLRPHLKTSKCVEIARMMLAGQPGGATVSTLSEAEYFFANGIKDITYAVPIAPGKLEQAAKLMRSGLDLKILLDSGETAAIVAQKGAELDVQFNTLIEIDSDGHRTGIKHDSPALIDAGRILASSAGATLEGVLTHAGSSYGCRSVEAIIAMAEQERAAAVLAAERLRGAGLTCLTVSIGSSPTAYFAKNLEGVTEARAGVFVFHDLFQASLGVCELDDLALSVLTEIIGIDRDTNRLFIDAGGLALSKDRSTQIAAEDLGFGLASRPGEPVKGSQLIVSQVFQEHGVITPRTADADLSDYRIGERLLVWPNHACMTAAAHGVYHVTEDDATITTKWQRVNGWRAEDTPALEVA